MTDAEDRVLNSLLKEAVGGKRAPDLSQRILRAWQAEQAGLYPEDALCPLEDLPRPAGERETPLGWATPEPLAAGPAEAPGDEWKGSSADGGTGCSVRPVHLASGGSASGGSASGKLATGRPSQRGAAGSRRRSSELWLPLASIGALALGGLSLAVAFDVNFWLGRPEAPPAEQRAEAGTRSGGQVGSGGLARRGIEHPETAGLASHPPQDLAAPRTDPEQTATQRTDQRPAVEIIPPVFAQSDPVAASASDQSRPGIQPALGDSEVISLIDESLRRKWHQVGLPDVPPAVPEAWCRRVFLGLIGRVPSTEELGRFATDAFDRQAVVDTLLGPEYEDEFVEHWAGSWTRLLLGRAGIEQPGIQQAMLGYLRAAWRGGKHYDDLVGDLLVASGSLAPDAEDYNPAISFLAADLGRDATAATSRTARLLLGQQVGCVQCHSHPGGAWAQQDFWELNAFFRQVRLERPDGSVRLVDRDFLPQQAEAEVYYERADGKLQVAFPRFDGRPGQRSGRLRDGRRREQLARFVRQSDQLPRAAVNRVWSQFFGYGLVNPVDDLGEHNPSPHPELLEQLAEQFAAHEFDLKRLMRWVALSEPYARSSRPLDAVVESDSPAQGSPPLFSHYYTRPLPTNEVFQSLQFVAGLRQRGGGKTDPKVFARQLNVDATGQPLASQPLNAQVQQSLALINGELIRQAVHPHHRSVLSEVLKSRMPLEEKVNHLFLAAVSRRPDGREMRLIRQMLDAASDVDAGLQDVWWALLNSSEFLLDH